MVQQDLVRNISTAHSENTQREEARGMRGLDQLTIATVEGNDMSLLLPHLSTVANQDGAAILDVSRNQITTLNETGAFVWNGLLQGQTTEQIIHNLATACNTTPTNVEQGVHSFLEQLRTEHLLCR